MKKTSKIEMEISSDLKNKKDEYGEDITEWLSDYFHRCIYKHMQNILECDSFESDIMEIMINEDLYFPENIKEFHDLGGFKIGLKEC